MWIERALPDQIASAVSYLRASGNLTEAKSQLAVARATVDQLSADLAEAARARSDAEKSEQAARSAVSIEQADLTRVREVRDQAENTLLSTSKYLIDTKQRLARIGSPSDVVTTASDRTEQAKLLQQEVARTEESLAPLKAQLSTLETMLAKKQKNLGELTATAADALKKLAELQEKEEKIRKNVDQAKREQSELEERFYKEQSAGTAPTAVSPAQQPDQAGQR